MIIIGKTVNAHNHEGDHIAGEVMLVFKDAIVSGTNEYVAVTYCLVVDAAGKVHTIRPRDIYEVVQP